MIPLWITEWIAPRLFKLAGAGVIAVIGVSSCLVRDAHLRQEGKQEIVQASKEAGAQANAANEKVRADAAKPGAAERLRREACRDCR
jgi:hypothetical protein